MRNLALGLLVCVLANPAGPVKDISGKWSGAVDLTADGQTNRVVISCEFTVDGEKVSGVFGPAPDTQFRFEGGTFDGTKIAFRVAAPNRFFTFALAVADKNRLTGRVASEDGKATGPVTLARDAAEAYTRDDFPELRGPYLGQAPPGAKAERFAPGIVSLPGGPDSVPQFSPDGREIYWSRVGPGGGLRVSRLENGRWTFPQPIRLASGVGLDLTPTLFAQGRKMLVHSTRPLPDGRQPARGFFTFWIASREGDAWGAATPIDSFFTGREDFSTIAEDGTIYLGPAGGQGTVMRIRPEGAGYGKPEPLVPAIGGFPAMVGPNGEYLIVAKGDPAGGRDLFILFRKADGTFGEPINMGPAVNSPASEQFAALSPDGKYFFFASERGGDFDVYWVDAGFIGDLKKKAATTPPTTPEA